jgi:hypothetical protein
MSERVPQGVPQPQGVGEDPLTHYTRVFVRFLQVLFGSFEKGAYHWDLDDKSSDITISDQATIRKEEVEKRPAILVSRGPLALTNVAMDQFAGPILQRDAQGKPYFKANLDPTTGARRHTDLSSCTMTYNCLSREGLEAQRIAWICGYFTRALKRTLMKAGMHRVGEDVQFGAESSPGSVVQPDPNEIVMVSVSVPFYFQDTWSVEPVDKLLLKHIELALRSSSEAALPPVPIKEASIYGQVLGVEKVFSLNTRVSVGPVKSPKPRKL